MTLSPKRPSHTRERKGAAASSRCCRAFFEDICSPHELRTIEQRFQLLFLLTSGRSYSEIGEITGASSATISRASRQIANSHCGIAEIILRHTKAED